ncbi:tRNA (adenosine(37)-N6)-threonylcarbamoyltransferase complex dimerization subunit type 1 TsaB [Aquimarina intermedia]|uniref:tRNA threonylcarbamoyladenosine biosynthesis protein TsaB n=1 Tax=Aquimarina intermedia TaxID=350814 RepID=A0A5S5CBX4_9FLAO|nr:tRNA (adenosine(37)-N6)-threonylcarbamoyltransferase complex dimerization subunit type 1 TsaB [Aquimarina intermedia]TYP76002.1 tRNA threonylcarbamoyladenosine biosynthesis protein TsaB [Aquimarina intermedia]
MGYILCLETATTNCSVALTKNGKVIAIREDIDGGYSHAERLHVFIEEVLTETGVKASELDAVAVGKGPGSYTGLRIGVAAAKGLCFALDIPLIAIPTLALLALQVADKKEVSTIIPMIDARRMEVYASVYTHDYHEIRETRAEILDPTSYLGYLNEGIVCFIGSGVAKFAEICDHPNAIFIKNAMPSTKEMALQSYSKFKQQDFEDVTYFDPYYLKDFVTG